MDLAARVRRMEDGAATADVLVACFTPDATFDVTALGLAAYENHDAIRGFFAGAFADTAHHAHHVTGFRLSRLEADAARGHGAVFATAIARGGGRIAVHCRYDIDFLRAVDGWRMRRFVEYPHAPARRRGDRAACERGGTSGVNGLGR